MTKSFFVGFIMGATTVWALKDSIVVRVDARTRIIRARTAHRLRAAADAVEGGVVGAPAADAPTRVARAS